MIVFPLYGNSTDKYYKYDECWFIYIQDWYSLAVWQEWGTYELMSKGYGVDMPNEISGTVKKGFS